MASLRPDGRYQHNQRIPGTKRAKTGYGDTEAEAIEDAANKVAAELAAMEDGHLAASPPTPDPSTRSTADGPTLHDFARTTWFPTLVATGPYTQRRYSGVYRDHIRPHIGGIPLAELTHEDLQGWVELQIAAGVSAKQIGYNKERLGSILKLAVDLGRIGRNPMARVVAPKVEDDPRERVLDPESAAALLERVRGTDLSAPVYLALVLGLRRGEALGLRWGDLDRSARTLAVVRQRQALPKPENAPNRRHTDPAKVVERPVKGKSRRVLSLTPKMVDEIDARGDLDSLPDEHGPRDLGGHVCTVLAQGESDRRAWTPDNLTERWGLAREGFGLPDWTYHDLRHGAAGLLLAAGADLLTVSSVLGHTSVDTTLLYAEATKRNRREAARLAERIGF